MEYDFREIEKKWQKRWAERGTYRVKEDPSRPKYYVLDMFPYPSGAGLHVGHPLGYIASDIYTRYKRLKGFNVLHPMGYDAFGLPAEQYAIQTGQHPAVTTERNIARYREQLDKIGFSFDWDREVRTCDPKYYHWTQWAFLKMFGSYYSYDENRAMPIERLVEAFDRSGTEGLNVACTKELSFTAARWKAMDEAEREGVLQNYRLAFRADTLVNWCPELGTVLANDEVKDGLSVRGGYPVVQKRMKQWLLRVTAYAQRMLDGLDTLEWSDSLKEIQRNWIGRSEGAQIFFGLKGFDEKLEVFTTRADTIFGATFMVLAPEHALVGKIAAPEQREAVERYIEETKKRSERERMADTKRVSGQFTGAYAINPFNGTEIPIYISDYVLAGYGTGAIMAVPAHDSRDYAFAKHFDLPIIPVVEGGDLSVASYDAKAGRMINSDFLTGMDVKEAIPAMIAEVERRGFGSRRVNYRLRDAIFSRQRYWGEPFPIYYKDDIARPLAEDCLPLELPPIENFGPTAEGEPPLARVEGWQTPEGYPYELSTMPGFAGSSAYYLRYMDPHNDSELVSKRANEYWRSVDLYVGGIEHATGHLMYSRFWNMFLYDLGYVCEPEPFRKLVNQGMIQGRSNFVYRVKGTNARSGGVPPLEARVRRRRVRARGRQVRLRLGYREDVEVDVQRRESRPDRPRLRSRHAAHVRNVPRTARAEQAVGHERHRRRAQVPAPLLADVFRPRRPSGRDRRRADGRRAESAAQNDQESDRGYRELFVQYFGQRFYDLSERTRRAEVHEAGRTGAAGGADRSVRSAHRRGDMGEARTRRFRFRRAFPGVRRALPDRAERRIPRVVQR